MEETGLSARHTKWRLAPMDESVRKDFSKSRAKSKPDNVVINVLSQRFHTIDEAREFLSEPKKDYGEFMSSLMPQLTKELPDFNKAANQLADAIMNNKNIGISGDYDCDGNCSVAVMCRFLMESGVATSRLFPHIPNRERDGYGINSSAVTAMKENKVDLLLTLDNGTLAFGPIEQATKGSRNMDVVVVDHHPNQSGQRLPYKALVVNANRHDNKAAKSNVLKKIPGIGDLAAVGMTFLLCARTYEILKSKGYYAQHEQPDPQSWLGLVALATIGDVVNISSPINRSLVAMGLDQIRENNDLRIKALVEVAQTPFPPDSETLAFQIAPIINAPGRLGQSVGWSFLSGFAADVSTTDPQRYQEIIHDVSEEIRSVEKDLVSLGKAKGKHQQWSLPVHPEDRLSQSEVSTQSVVSSKERLLMLLSKECNDKRKELEGELTKQARAMAEKQIGEENPNILFIAGKDWHPGLIGIVAGRLKEQFNLPTVVASIGKDGKCKCSARSIKVKDHPVDIGEAFRELQADGVLSSGGGHVMAAGASFKEENLGAFKVGLREKLGEQAKIARDVSDTEVSDIIDFSKLPKKARESGSSLSMRADEPDLEKLKEAVIQTHTLEPYGEGNPRPRVVLTGMIAENLDYSNDGKHIKHLTISNGGATLTARAFHVGGTEVEKCLKGMQRCHLLGSFAVRDGQLEFRIEDACPAKDERTLKHVVSKARTDVSIACLTMDAPRTAQSQGVFTSALQAKQQLG